MFFLWHTFFFVKQKTAYEFEYGLVGSEMCIRDSCTGTSPEALAEEIGDKGASRLKAILTESLNEYLLPLRRKRRQLEKDPEHIRNVLMKGIERARKIAEETLVEVRRAMGMEY